MPWIGTDPADWAAQQKARLRAIYQTATQLVLSAMGRGSASGSYGPGLIPVRTGNLARSAIMQVGKAPTEADGPFTSSPDASAIINLDLGDHAYFGWQAKYARRINYGFSDTDSLGRTYNQAGRGFAEAIAARWQTYVKDATNEVGSV